MLRISVANDCATSAGDRKMADTMQVKSKQRVADHGEVFTAEREVKAMCDLVRSETERIESRFLEPACGDGNFLVEILRRKLAVVKGRYGKNAHDYERYSVLSVTSLYGVDILPDNADACRARLFGIWDEEYRAAVKGSADERCRDAVRFILERNIVCGDALTLLRNDGEPIIFAEWSAVNGVMLKRRDFRLDVLLKENADDNQYDMQLSLFVEDTNDANDVSHWDYDTETRMYIPKPVREYPLTDYREVQHSEVQHSETQDREVQHGE